MPTRQFARYKQQYPFSCGAFALMCAAAELAVEKMPKLATGSAHGAGWDGEDLVVSPRTENALYWVTSGKTMNAYSMPHDVVLCARMLGLDCTIHMIPGLYTWALATLYSNIMSRCESTGIPILRVAPPPLETNQRELCVVSTFVVGLHYVMRRPDGEYMDPADGRDYANFHALNTWEKCYSRTGLSIVLTGREASGEELAHLFEES